MEPLQRYASLAAGFRQRLQRRIDGLVGELEGAVVMAERELGATVLERLHRLRRVHMLIAHEPARLVGADGQNRQPERPVTLTRGAEVMAVAIPESPR